MHGTQLLCLRGCGLWQEGHRLSLRVSKLAERLVGRGAPLVSHLAVHFRERFLAFAFLAVGYTPSFANFNYKTAMATVKEVLGYEPYGYWRCVMALVADSRLSSEKPSGFSPRTAQTRS